MSRQDEAFRAWWAGAEADTTTSMTGTYPQSREAQLAMDLLSDAVEKAHHAGWDASHEHDAAKRLVIKTCENCLPLEPLRLRCQKYAELLEAYRELDGAWTEGEFHRLHDGPCEYGGNRMLKARAKIAKLEAQPCDETPKQ